MMEHKIIVTVDLEFSNVSLIIRLINDLNVLLNDNDIVLDSDWYEHNIMYYPFVVWDLFTYVWHFPPHNIQRLQCDLIFDIYSRMIQFEGANSYIAIVV